MPFNDWNYPLSLITYFIVGRMAADAMKIDYRVTDAMNIKLANLRSSSPTVLQQNL